MPTGNAKFAAAAKEATCGLLSTVGQTAAGYAAWGLLTPGPFDEWAALGIAGVAGLAYASGCQWDTGGASTLPPSYTAGCQSIGGGYGFLMVNLGAGPVWIGPGANDSDKVTSITGVTVSCTSNCVMVVSYVTSNGPRSYTEIRSREADFAGWSWSLDPITGSCDSTRPPDAPSPVPPYTYTDPDDGCELTVNFEGFVVEPGGRTGAAWKIEPAAQTRANGGIIGG